MVRPLGGSVNEMHEGARQFKSHNVGSRKRAVEGISTLMHQMSLTNASCRTCGEHGLEQMLLLSLHDYGASACCIVNDTYTTHTVELRL